MSSPDELEKLHLVPPCISDGPTTLHLGPIPRNAIRYCRGDVVAFIERGNQVDVQLACVTATGVFIAGARWTKEGIPCGRLMGVQLCAYRKFDGAWTVLDSRVSKMLPKIDAVLEDE